MAGQALVPCPCCNALNGGRVVHTQELPAGRQRVRKCDRCGHRWGTMEVPIETWEGANRIAQARDVVGQAAQALTKIHDFLSKQAAL